MKKIVVIGGGTGTFTVLKGLKHYTKNITAIVSMADSGGSSGVLRDEFGVLPPGDIRRCLIALSEDSNILRKLFDYRFSGDSEKHSLGNLIMAALEKIKGNAAEATKEAAKILHITGEVLPVTIDNSNLYALLENEQIVKGETNIDIPRDHDSNLKIKKIWLDPEAQVYEGAVNALMNADLIVIGPGDLYTSVLPNLVVNGMKEALKQSKAKKIYVCNIMTKYGETNNFKASDFFSEIEKYLEIELDYAILNNKKPDEKLMGRYKEENASFVEPDLIEKEQGPKIIKEDLISDSFLLRHDSQKLANVLMGIK